MPVCSPGGGGAAPSCSKRVWRKDAKRAAPVSACKYRTRAELNEAYRAPNRAPKHGEIVPRIWNQISITKKT